MTGLVVPGGGLGLRAEWGLGWQAAGRVGPSVCVGGGGAWGGRVGGEGGLDMEGPSGAGWGLGRVGRRVGWYGLVEVNVCTARNGNGGVQNALRSG